MEMKFKFLMPTQVIMEPEAVIKNSHFFRGMGQRCLIVTGRKSAKVCGALEDVISALDKEGIAWEIFDQVGQNPLLSTCVIGGQTAAAFKADFLVGIGGGSPLDATKAIAAFATNDMLPMDIFSFRQMSALPFALVGTTAGTGSEVTCYSVLTVDETGRKRSWGNRESYARIAFCDPKYTDSLDREVTISTALDTLTHAIESYFSKMADGVSQAFSILGLELLLPALKELQKIPAEKFIPSADLRQHLYLASLYAGMAINKTGTTFCHQMGYVLTEDYDILHGQACAAFLPIYIRHSILACPQAAHRLFTHLGVFAGPFIQLVESFQEVKWPSFTLPQIEELLDRWEGTNGIVRSPGNLDRESQRKIALEVLGRQAVL